MLAEIEVTGAVDEARLARSPPRIATSPLVKTALLDDDAELGARPRCSRLRAFQRRLRARRPGRLTLAYNGVTVLDRGTPQGVERDVSSGVCRIELDLGIGEGRAGI